MAVYTEVPFAEAAALIERLNLGVLTELKGVVGQNVTRGETLAVLGVAMASACPAVGVILCHRYRLDTELYGAALTASILIYLVLAPLYRGLLMGG